MVTTDTVARTDRTARITAGNFLRTVWRVHFYAAVFAAPILVLMSVTGLAILYSDTINGLTLHHLTRVEPQGTARSMDSLQAAAAVRAPQGSHLVLVTTPKAADHAIAFQYTSDNSTYTDVYVNQYTGTVTGTHVNGDDVVGWANRLHKEIGNTSITVPLPSLAHLVDPTSGPLIQRYPVGALVIEICVGWALVLALSGIYLWWPRRSEKGKALLRPRWRKRGRLRWRDLHATAGILGAATFLIFIVSGMPWSSYWGSYWSTAAEKITPASTDAGLFGGDVKSPLAKEGTLDRFGHHISWAMREATQPTSGTSKNGSMAGMDMSGGAEAGSATSSPAPAQVSLDAVARAATQEHMMAGYTIATPQDVTSSKGTTYGSYTLSNPWPAQLQNERAVYLDQFTAKTLASTSQSHYGALGWVTELGVLTHMGTQFGLVNKVLMTVGCLLIMASIATSLAMWWMRRPSGATGLPRRPANPRLPWALSGIAAALAVIYPLWGVSLIAVLLIDRFVIRRAPRLRAIFNLK